MWVIGGLRYSSDWIEEDDVWYSSDGINWTESTSSAAWTDRYNHSSIVYSSRIWVIGGGYDSGDYSYQLNDVWYSYNGSSWTRATSSAGFMDRVRRWVIDGWRSRELS